MAAGVRIARTPPVLQTGVQTDYTIQRKRILLARPARGGEERRSARAADLPNVYAVGYDGTSPLARFKLGIPTLHRAASFAV